jgi:uncharacterized protein YyaL (SSP411 family)
MRQILSLLIIVFALSTGFSCTTVAASNQLSGHPSPYLALHADDPVHWQSWQAEVFEQARSSNRLVLVSVGYFSCHWCHVMQRQSYQHAQTAEFLNRNFISVKVDRELEPDLDRRLITFVEQVRGVAGWPLNVFLTPDGYPLTGFTYLPQADFLRLLQQLEGEWKQNHLALSASAREFFELGLRHSDGQVENRKMSSQALEEAFVSQAMLAALNLKAHRLWPEHKFASLAMQTLDFVEAQLKHPQGGQGNLFAAELSWQVVTIGRQLSMGANNHPAMFFLQIKFATDGSLAVG